jgi:hypothetical protein
MASKRARPSTTPYFTSSSQCGDMVGEPQVFGSAARGRPSTCPGCGRACRDGDRGDQAVVVAAADRRVEEEVAGLLEAGERAELVDAALDVGVAGLPVVGLGAVRCSTGSVAKRPVDFTSTTKRRVRVQRPRGRARASRRPCRRRSRRPRCRPRRSGRRRRRSRGRHRRRAQHLVAMACSISMSSGLGL